MSQTRPPVTAEHVKNVLAQQDIIRIFIDSMPFGYGNQASNKNLMKKIRQLGFAGKFEVIYFKHGNTKNPKSENNKAKIARLFDLPSDFSDCYYDPVNHIEFIEATIFYANKSNHDTVALSFSGSQLPFCMDALANKRLDPSLIDITTDGIKMKAPTCRNEASIFGALLHINIQPYYGKTPIGETEPIVKFVKSNSEEMISFEKGAKQFFNTPTETLDDAFNFIDTSQHFTLSNFPGLKRFMLGLQAQEFYTIPIHGWPVQMLEKNPNKERHGKKNQDLFPGKILSYICASAEAIKENPALQKKPLLLPIFYDYEQELEIINNIIKHDDWGKYSDWKNRHPKMAEYIKDLALKNNFSIADLKDKNAIAQINQLQPGHMMLVSVGKLPQPLFNGLYIDAGGTALTHVFEGENTRNALLSSLQKPFLRSQPWDLDDFGLKPNKNLQKRYDQYDKSTDFIFQSHWVASFISDAQKSGSEATLYFNSIYEKALDPENDRVLSAIKQGIYLLIDEQLITMEELNKPSPFNSQTYQYEDFFNSLSNVFKKNVMQAEAKFFVSMSKLATSCPSYFQQDHDYWKNALNPQGASVCASGFFAYRGQCISQPKVTENNIKGYLKF